MKAVSKKVKSTLAKWGGILLNPRLLLCFALAWLLTNGWCYLFIFFGVRFGIGWMAAAGTAYAGFLWFPCTPEKLLTLTIALFLLRLLFPHDEKTLLALRKELEALRTTAKRRKEERS
ncbi:MAG: hypothetical protein ACI3WR_03395 [Oscillospiraceae bacterium]